MLASGRVFGPGTDVCLRLLEIPQAVGALQGVKMELQVARSCLGEVTCTRSGMAFAARRGHPRGRIPAEARHAAEGPDPGKHKDLFEHGPGDRTRRSHEHQGAVRGQPSQHQLPRDAEAMCRTRQFRSDDAPRLQPRVSADRAQGRRLRKGRQKCRHMGQSLGDAVS